MKYKEQVYEAIKSPDVWEYIWREVKTFDDMEQFIDSCTKQKVWKELSFIIRYKLSSEVIGTTRIGDIDTAN